MRKPTTWVLPAPEPYQGAGRCRGCAGGRGVRRFIEGLTGPIAEEADTGA